MGLLRHVFSPLAIGLVSLSTALVFLWTLSFPMSQCSTNVAASLVFHLLDLCLHGSRQMEVWSWRCPEPPRHLLGLHALSDLCVCLIGIQGIFVFTFAFLNHFCHRLEHIGSFIFLYIYFSWFIFLVLSHKDVLAFHLHQAFPLWQHFGKGRSHVLILQASRGRRQDQCFLRHVKVHLFHEHPTFHCRRKFNSVLCEFLVSGFQADHKLSKRLILSYCAPVEVFLQVLLHFFFFPLGILLIQSTQHLLVSALLA